MEVTKITLRGYNLNAAKILDKMIDIVVSNGGSLVETKPYVITPRLYVVKDESQPGAPEEILRVRSYVEFVLNETFYYVQLGGNPFLDCLYIKENIYDETVSSPQKGAELSLSWFVGKSEYAHLDDDAVVKNAQALFQHLLEQPVTTAHPTKKRTAFRRLKGAKE